MTHDERNPTKGQRPLEWMRFDPVEFGLLCDGLTFAQVGALTKVMLHLWQRGPLQEAEVRRVAKGESDAIVDLLSTFGEGKSLDMVEAAREYGEGRKRQRSEAGKASAAKRNEKPTDVQRSLNERPTDVLSMSLSSSKSNSESESEKKERASARRKADPIVHEPEIIPAGVTPAMWSAIKRWAQYRKEKKSKLTPTGMDAFVKKCVALGEARTVAAIENSIAQGWTGMYEPQHDRSNGSESIADKTQGVLDILRAGRL